MHSREIVRKLQNAHTDYIESIYRHLARLPGNPKGIEIVNVGDTRVFLSNENRLENRAIFTGNESLEELREVTSIFQRKGVDGYFELNPANFYRTAPFSWKSEILPALLDLGYFPGMFRCVWFQDRSGMDQTVRGDSKKVRRFLCDDAEEYAAAKLKVEPVDDEDLEKEKSAIQYGFTRDWMNYVGYENDDPVSVSNLFLSNEIGYLAWGYTRSEYRRKGHHRLHVDARCRDAFASGCDLVFSVTDFNIPSSLSLQKSGFRLAYNYLFLETSPTTR